MGWPYQLMDGGWASDTDAMTPSAGVNLPEILQFAKARNVRLWVWSHWTTMDRNNNYLRAFPLYERWGLAGVKIDFMNRDDQDMVNWYEKIAKSAAEHHLMVDFHGAFKPTGMIRTFPNQITREGILGNEYNKWSARVTPEHKTTLPFTRLALGPGDFTPGGFLNTPPAQFQPVQQTGRRAGGQRSRRPPRPKCRERAARNWRCLSASTARFAASAITPATSRTSRGLISSKSCPPSGMTPKCWMPTWAGTWSWSAAAATTGSSAP